jgi:hypothetical protein
MHRFFMMGHQPLPPSNGVKSLPLTFTNKENLIRKETVDNSALFRRIKGIRPHYFFCWLNKMRANAHGP